MKYLNQVFKGRWCSFSLFQGLNGGSKNKIWALVFFLNKAFWKYPTLSLYVFAFFFKKVRDSFIKETRKLVYNWFGPKSTSHNWFLLFDPISEIFLSSSLKKISVQSSFGHLNYFHLIDWWPKTKYQLSDDFFFLSFQFKKKRG